MKTKAILTVALLLATFSASAQWRRAAVEAGVGFSYAEEDLFYDSPVFTWQATFYMERGFWKKSFLAQHSFLRTGISVMTRGNAYEMYSVYAASLRKGSFTYTALQLPVRLGWRFDLSKKLSDCALSLWAGPAVNVGLTGLMTDSQSSERYQSELVNYERQYEGAELFSVLSRFDASVGVGFSFDWRSLSLSALWDMGLFPLRDKSDALVFVNVEPEEETTGRYSYSRALILSLGYRFNLKEKNKAEPPSGPVFM